MKKVASAALVAASLLFGGPSLGAQERVVPTSQGEVQLSYAPLVQEAAPAVVNIYTKKVVKSKRQAMSDDPIYRFFFGRGRSFGVPRERVSRSLGSGVIVRPSGVIITNNHVIEGADEITVVLSDRREFEAELVLADPSTDLAILQLPGDLTDLPTLQLGNSDDVLVGDIVLAIGNPFGIGQTVTSGIVSATARTQQGITDFGFFIQTDAAVNPGNSGGALVGINGELIGINTAIYTRTGTTNGIGFAVPAAMVQSVLRAALNEGELVRPWLGLSGQNVTADLAAGLGLDRAGGVLVSELYDNAPLDKAGLQPGDVILAIDGKEIVDEGSLNFRIATQEPGSQIELTVLSDGQPRQVMVTLELPPEDPDRDLTKLDGPHPFQGVTVANLNPRFNEELKVPLMARGVVVLETDPRVPNALKRYWRRGDILLALNGQSIADVAGLAALLAEPQGQYLYRLRRRGATLECIVVPNRRSQCQQLR